MDEKKCLNCDHQIDVAQKFCSYCGQTTHLHRFTLVHFFHEVFHAFTHTDKGIFYLLKELAIRPGIVAKEYIAGKRKKYFNPFTFFLILAAAYVLSAGLTKSEKQADQARYVKISEIKNVKEREKIAAIYKRVSKSQDFFKKNGNILAMIAVPFLLVIFGSFIIEKVIIIQNIW